MLSKEKNVVLEIMKWIDLLLLTCFAIAEHMVINREMYSGWWRVIPQTRNRNCNRDVVLTTVLKTSHRDRLSDRLSQGGPQLLSFVKKLCPSFQLRIKMKKKERACALFVNALRPSFCLPIIDQLLPLILKWVWESNLLPVYRVMACTLISFAFSLWSRSCGQLLEGKQWACCCGGKAEAYRQFVFLCFSFPPSRLSTGNFWCLVAPATFKT